VTGTPIAAATNPNNPTICAGDPIPALTVNAPGAGLQVNWYGSALGGVALATNTNSFTPTSTQAGINTYYAEVTQVSPICVSPRTAVILTINPTSASTTNITVCAPELPYTWNGVPYNAAGSYTYTTNNYLGCDSVATLNLTVTPGTNPTFTILDSICTGATPPILPPTSNNGITGTWSPSVVSNTTTGSYTFTPTAGQCANNVTITVLVRVNAVPTLAQMNVSSNSPICAGSALNLYANGGVDYEWSGPAPYAVTFQNPVRANATVPMSGNYYVTVTTAAGCSSTVMIPVTINPMPNPTASNNGPLCAGTALNLTSTGGLSYNWSGPNYSSNVQNPTISPVSTTSAGTYVVTVTGTGGCTSTAQTTVVVNALPIATASNNGPLCTGDTLSFISGGGTGYSWTGPSFSNATQNPTILNSTTALNGTYTVTVTGTGGCTSTAQTTVTINNNPIPSIIGDTVICNGESTTLTANGGATYVWGSTVGGSITVSPNTTTVYQVVATSGQGCTQSASVSVDVSNLIMNAITSISDTCSHSNGSISLNVGSGIGAYIYQWSGGGSNSNSLTHLNTGDYIVTVTDAAGCQLVDTINVGNFPLPMLSIANSTDDHCSMGIGTANVIASGGTGNYYYQWNTLPTQNTANATNLTAGTYTLNVNDEHCSNSITVTIGDIAGPSADAGYTSNTNGNVQFNDQSTGATHWLWRFDENNSSTNQHPTYRYDNGGLFEVVLTVTDNFGCIDTALIQVVVDEGMDIWIPDAFTPNGDGTNDDFGPVARGYRKENYQMVIYDRWGKQLFITDDYFKHWNGTIEGEPIMTNAVYVYIIHIRDLAGKMHKYQGRVTLIVGL
jgi:gliding motility-associated-like protein